ncbi:hypothetical protein B0A55_01846 [Friedmanniomyces simplex]|uniref:Uncharacterized protein n=1 Tax=Friedmanniomyces simplex TaxID=329884 RepID=A0A4U0XL69_9PEZI|nr:hypothetical protein B0A55_01846 [Friedmanniomyces simplex]
MPRTLPWLAQAAKKPEAKKASSPAPKRKRAATPDEDLVDSDLNTTGVPTPQRRERKAKARSPSTSPPPAPPDIEYMHEGYTADDIWTMVEDEFHSTAQAFTQHIHHAEYVRLKKLAKSRGADTLQTITRPTDGRTAQSNGTELRLEAEEKARQAKSGLKGSGVGDESEEDDDEYMHDPQLAGLMTGSQREAQDLTVLAKARSNTRAAAGFTKSPQKVRRKQQLAEETSRNSVRSRAKQTVSENEDSDENDLDGPSRARQASKPKFLAARPSKASNGSVSGTEKADKQPEASGFFKRFTSAADENTHSSKASAAQTSRVSASSTKTAASSSKPPLPSADADQDDDYTFLSNGRSQAASNFLAKR